MTKKGIDVSTHNGSIDWSAVKNAGVDFVIIRAGYGRELSQKDKRFEEYYAGCKAHGIPCGAYWYSYCNSVEDAVKEAKTCLEVIKGKQFEYPVYFDLEESSQLNKGKTFCSEIVKAFCNTLEASGYFTGLYMSRSPLTSHITADVRERYALWVAEYNSKCNYTGSYGMWQKTSSGSVNGIKGRVDMNECYLDYPSVIKMAGLNGYSNKFEDKPIEKVEAAPVKEEYTTYVVKKGDSLWKIAVEFFGSGSYYKEIMKASGISSETIFPNQVLKIPKK